MRRTVGTVRRTVAAPGAKLRPFQHASPAMSDTPPDRLSNDPRSKFYDEAVLERGIGIRFNGVERTNVEEYCISEGWVRLPVGKALDRRGQPMTMKVKGTVEAWYRSPEQDSE